ncbi:MAG: hypothetical protein ACLR4Z_00270 [Butyricicoccaceae bacterium]
MATTRIMPLHIGKGRTESCAISKIIDYVANLQRPTTAGSSPAMSVTAVWPTPSSCWPSASILPPPDGSGAQMM